MFSGIVEAVEPIIQVRSQKDVVRIEVKRPEFFLDVKTGDSIAVNGVCLTVEELSPNSLWFAVGPETLKVLNKSADQGEAFLNQSMNLERSLKFSDRIHGHLVTGHVDGRGVVLQRKALEESLELEIAYPASLKPFIWKKGSVCINGVSLTVNTVSSTAETLSLSVCLIPETLKRTQLPFLAVGDQVNIEADYMAKAIRHNLEIGGLGGA